MPWLLAVKKKKLLHLHQLQQLKLQQQHQQLLLLMQSQLTQLLQLQQLMLSQLTLLLQHQQLTLSQLTQHQQNNQLIIEKADLRVGFFYEHRLCADLSDLHVLTCVPVLHVLRYALIQAAGSAPKHRMFSFRQHRIPPLSPLSTYFAA
ncbi:hypothetical protein PQR63_06780 [Herbaspirillum rhizosphaerae]|uniref:Uncharacterized protein n=1 Tax=Herbaspirillum rhizosphaerae TaxID=346179 RepID=A0ABW8Z4U5_9BURK